MGHPLPPLRLIAILPPEPIASMVRVEQERIASTWGPRHALRTPPHITLIPPIAVPEADMPGLEDMASGISAGHPAFNLRLRGFGAFTPHVIFVRVLISEDLEGLHRDWRRRLEEGMPEAIARYPDKPYRPHLTLAHRDVDEANFDVIWHHYGERRLDITYRVKSFALLDLGRGGWRVRREFPLGHGQPDATPDQSVGNG